MKVLTFLKFCEMLNEIAFCDEDEKGKNLSIEIHEILLKICNSVYIHPFALDQNEVLTNSDLTDIYLDIMSMPFKPELITELFEEWIAEFRTEREIRLTNNDYTILLPYRKFIPRICYYTAHSSAQEIRLPSTLDEFISDCFRNGIELKWKK